MGRLKALKPRLEVAPTRLKSSTSHEVRDKAIHWRKWYRSKRWQALRQQVLRRDGWQCQQTGVLLVGRHPAPNSPVVDHIKPHRGDPELFWDPDNLQAVSKEWHDSVKQSMEKRHLGNP